MNKFANILFAGKCNAFCPDCIGKQIDSSLSVDNLDMRPLKNIQPFIHILQQQDIKEISLTWTITDPLLYKHQKQLIECLRTSIPWAKLSVHTNGRLIKKIPEIFNLYDRAAISIPSFHEDIYQILMGTKWIPNIEEIHKVSRIPIKISTLITDLNRHDIKDFIESCYQKWVKRLVLRKVFWEMRSLYTLIDVDSIVMTCKSSFMNNEVYDYKGMEVTLREFESTENTCYNLFSDGTISDKYLLSETKK